MLRVAICDDDLTVCEQVETMLLDLNYALHGEIEIDVFYSGEELYRFLHNKEYYDLIFLDIELKRMNGVDLGKKIRDEMLNETTKIVYISSKESYAMELFEIRPFHFLIKPIQASKIKEVVIKVMQLLELERKLFEYQIGRTNYKVLMRDIIYFESDGKKVKLYLKDNEQEFYHKLSDIQKQMNSKDFIMIHKSYLVNYYHVIEYQYNYVKMSNQVILPISQQHRKLVRDYFLRSRQGREVDDIK
jgi:DNA-binding LytR/AlgR family response regulator